MRPNGAKTAKTAKTALTLGVLLICIMVVYPVSADSKARERFLEKLVTISTVDDAAFAEDALVIWPSPDVQGTLDYDAMGSKMCEEYRTYGFLVIWFMDSSLFRREKEMSLLQSVICFSEGR